MPGPTSLVSLTDVKAHLNIPTEDTSHDTEIQGFIDDTQPIIEDIVGPVVQVNCDEWYDGGQQEIVLRTRPVVSVTSVTEYIGNVAYTLTSAASPDLAGPYSFVLDGGRIIRRRSGVMGAFPVGFSNVHVVYVAGRATVPTNVRLGTLELIRHNYQMTQLAGRPTFGGTAAEDTLATTPTGFAIPTRVIEMLGATRRFPSLA